MESMMIEHQILHQYGNLSYRLAPGATCEIVDIRVDEMHRREGVGGKLIRMLCEQVKSESDIRLVYAITRTTNVIAQRFYESQGFRAAGVLRNFYNGDDLGVDAIVYARDL